MKTTRVSTDYHITAEQMNKIKRSLTSALNAYSAEVTEKDVYQKAVAGLKYKSCNGKEVHLTVPKYSQKRKIEKHYLEGIRKHFNQSCDGKYTLIIHAEKRRRPWIPVTAGALAVAAGGAGTAIYFALQPTVSTFTVTMDLNGGKIEGISGNKIEVLEGSTYGELPSPIYEDGSMIFVGWIKEDSNEPVVPSEKIEGNVSVKATYDVAPASDVDVVGGSPNIQKSLTEISEGYIDETPWQLFIGGAEQPSATFEIVSAKPHAGITIDDGVSDHKIHIASNTAVGNYSFQVQGTYLDNTASANVTVIITADDVYTVTGGSTSLKGAAKTADHDKTPWKLSLNGTPIESGVTYSPSTTITGLNVDQSTGLVSWTNAIAKSPTDGYKFTVDASYGSKTYHSPEITLIITSDILSIEIEGPAVAVANADTQYTIKTYPEDKETNITWSIGDWDCGYKPEINSSTGVVRVEATCVASGVGFELIANDSISGLSCDEWIYVTAPWQNSTDIWGYTPDETGDPEYDDVWFKLGNLDSSTGNITVHNVNGEEKPSIPRTDFDMQIVIGDQVQAIGNDFLVGCSSFDSEINFSHASKCWRIGDDFMSGCTSFNQSIVFPVGIKEIGEEFLIHCTSFDSDFTIPATVESIGSQFMQYCDAMTSVIKIDCDALNFETADGSLAFTTENPSAACLTDPGIQIQTSDANWAILQSNFPDLHGTELEGIYRNLGRYQAP